MIKKGDIVRFGCVLFNVVDIDEEYCTLHSSEIGLKTKQTLNEVELVCKKEDRESLRRFLN